MSTTKTLSALLALALFSPAMVACSSERQGGYPLDHEDERRARMGKVTGEEGIMIFGGGKKNKGGENSGIGVNSFLWRGSLDTISFMPLTQVDPHGGVIITDWYEDPAVKGERFKLNILILGTELRADGIRVTAFRQVGGAGSWRDSTVSPKVGRDLEDRILTRARQLKIDSQ